MLPVPIENFSIEHDLLVVPSFRKFFEENQSELEIDKVFEVGYYLIQNPNDESVFFDAVKRQFPLPQKLFEKKLEISIPKPEEKSHTPNTSPTRKKRKRRKYHKFKKKENDQDVCCIVDCDEKVNNRLFQSLKTGMFKQKRRFDLKEWDKVCHYHYFSDLYHFKKNKNKS